MLNSDLLKDAKVLIIDDQALAQNFLKRALESLGIKSVYIAESAKHALRLCAEHNFNVILCSYNLSREKDGFHLFEEMKIKGFIKLTTAFIFVSAETSSALVNSVIELQPDDFLVKPFTAKELNTRLTRVLTRKNKLNNVYTALSDGKTRKALSLINRHLENPKLANMVPLLMRLKGDALLTLNENALAESFYKDLLSKHNFTWASVGLAKALLAQDKEAGAKAVLDELIDNPATKLAALDMLAKYHISNEEYELAYDEFNQASELSPRNINRHKNVLNLARLLHDYSGQFEAAKNMAKYGKRSIHDSPELYLAVARAGVDYALTLTSDESASILKQSQKYIEDMRTEFPNNPEAKEKISIVQARIHYLKDEQREAQKLIQAVMFNNSHDSGIEDKLDKAKAFHELGFREQAVDILENLDEFELEDEIGAKVLCEFVKQETLEKKEIQYSPRELNNMAVEFFKRNQLEPAIQAFSDATRLMPKNIKIALNMLQVLAEQNQHYGLQDHHKEHLDKCSLVLSNNTLDTDQQKRYETLLLKMKPKKNLSSNIESSKHELNPNKPERNKKGSVKAQV